MQVSSRFLPFADAATDHLPLPRLLRLSLFQVTVGMALALLIGTLNRVMIIELSVPATLVGLMVALPLVFAPFRALIGFKSDSHRSFLGWRRVPYIWFGSLLQFGGFAIMPFALILLSGDSQAHPLVGIAGAALAFLLVGAGLHTTQTVGLTLATDLAPVEAQPKVVALMCSMLLIGMAASAVIFGLLLRDFSQLRLIQVIQGAAAVTMILNVIALWKQEARDPERTRPDRATPAFRDAWQTFSRRSHARRRLVALGLGTVGFSMQDILLEPFGGEVLHLPVAATTALTALLALASLAGFVLAARALVRGTDPYRMAAWGAVVGIAGFSCVVLSAPMASIPAFALGVAGIGLGSGLFGHCTLTAAMSLAPKGQIGLALGVWGSVQATAAGIAIALGGALRDGLGSLASHGALGAALTDGSAGYLFVYHVELGLLFATLVAIGPLVRKPAFPASDGGPAAAWPNLDSLNLHEEVTP